MTPANVPFTPSYVNIDGWLCMMKTEKNGETVPVRLCNFIPYIASQFIQDDGAETKVDLEIGAFDVNGNPLRFTHVKGSKFNAMEWLNTEWGFEYYLGAGNKFKDHLRVFLQQTAAIAEKKTVYAVTGWKKTEIGW